MRGRSGGGHERGPAAVRMTAKMVRSVARLAAEVAKEGGIVWGWETHTRHTKEKRVQTLSCY